MNYATNKTAARKFKSIQVLPENAAAIEAALAEVNGRATAHAFTAYADISALTERGEKRLASLLYKKDFRGAHFAVTSGQSVANAYKNMRLGTTVTLERKTAGWYLTGAVQMSLGISGGRAELTFSQKRGIL